jgi:GNAT superfamily N-acetyltransferase
MDMFSEYYLEREGFRTVTTDYGFASFKIDGKECYLKDIYVKKEHRRGGHASEIAQMVESIAIEEGCDCIKGSIVPDLPGATECLAGQLKFGFKLFSSHENFIVLIKELDHGR